MSVESSFDDLVLPSELKERVIELAQATRNARRYNAPFRHVLLYGSPGTGENFANSDLVVSAFPQFSF